MKVNRKNIENLDIGYSVKFNRADERSYKEVFKYAFKADLDKDEFLGYEVFKTYQKALPHLRFIQGYGDVLNFNFEDEDELKRLSNIVAVEEYFTELRDLEEPVKVYETLDEIERNINNGQTYMTRNSIQDALLRKETENRLTDDSKKILSEFEKIINKE